MRFRRRKRKPNWSKTVCCLLKADMAAGSPIIQAAALLLCQKLGIKVPNVIEIEIEVDKTPRRLITARRV